MQKSAKFKAAMSDMLQLCRDWIFCPKTRAGKAFKFFLPGVFEPLCSAPLSHDKLKHIGHCRVVLESARVQSTAFTLPSP